MKKKAMELSINFIVILILSIVMLTSGILLLQRFIGSTQDLHRELDTQTINELERLLGTGQMTVIAFNNKAIKPGDSEIFGLGILNVKRTTEDFKVEVKASGAYTPANQKINIDPGYQESWLLYHGEARLEPDETTKIGIMVIPPRDATQGRYIYTVEIKAGQENYGVEKIYVTVR